MTENLLIIIGLSIDLISAFLMAFPDLINKVKKSRRAEDGKKEYHIREIINIKEAQRLVRIGMIGLVIGFIVQIIGHISQ